MRDNAIVYVRWSIAALLTSAALAGAQGSAAASRASADDRYVPVPGGWRIHLHEDGAYLRGKGILPDRDRLHPDDPIGRLVDNPRHHRRPLYPPGDKSFVWTEAERAQTPRVSFRPLILAYNAPRFVFDYHSAGGLLGHLWLGFVRQGGGDKWLHDWAEIDVRYTDGRLEYTLQDGAFEGVTVRLVATALADAAGLVVKVDIEGAGDGDALVWAYGGASAFFTNYNMLAPEFRFSPEQCAKDAYELTDGSFLLTRAFDKTDAIVGGDGQGVGVMRFLPEWEAHVRGGSSWPDAIGFGDPKRMIETPGKLAASAEATDVTASRAAKNCVVVQKVPVSQSGSSGYVVIGMGGNIRDCIAHPSAAYRAALARNESIAGRIVTQTPDPYLDSAMTMMAFATEGMWASQAYVHGGWSWRFAYLGWRILYGPTCYGWTDRVRTNIQNHCRIGRIAEGPDAGGLGSLLEFSALFYNMDEVFLDMVRHYWEYTGDVELMREIFPVLQGMLERQERRLRPGPEYLYENALNTWISDSHWYIRAQCTQSSAYTLRAYELLADLAEHLGEDTTPYRERAARIRADMQRLLWQNRLGVFAECLDTRGHRLLHPEPELPTLYHSAEFGAADPLQIYQMLHWADTHLRQEHTPGGGLLYWSSNWFPNSGRSYTHSTYELAYGEELNFAETNFRAGRADVGYALLRSALSGVFNGPTPGGLSCHCFVDGMQRANDEFADAISMWSRAVMEGLFGIRVRRPDAIVELTPQIPEAWPAASIRTPYFSYRFTRQHGAIEVDWESPVPVGVHLSLPVKAAEIRDASLDGSTVAYEMRAGVGLTWVGVVAPEAPRGTFRLTLVADDAPMPALVQVKRGDNVTLVPTISVSEWADPQALLSDAEIAGTGLQGIVDGEPGPGLLFVSTKGAKCPRWLPVRLEIDPTTSVGPPLWHPPDVPDKNPDRWTLVDLGTVFNANVSEVPQRVRDGAIPPEMPADQVGFGYWLEHVTRRSAPPCDAAWRAKVGDDGVAWTTDGIPFKTNRDGPNIGAVCLYNNAFPPSLSFPVSAEGRTLYLMISGMTHPAQSHVVNLRVTLRYSDGTSEARDLVNPFTIGDCWSTWLVRCFDTPANGFENIGGRSGPAGSSQVADSTRPVAVDTVAHLIAFSLRKAATLDRVELEAIANDVVFGVMGASVLH